MKIGVRVHDLGKSDAQTLASKAKKIGFDGVQLVLNKAIEGETGLPGSLNEEHVNEIAKCFQNEGLDISMLGAYFNPVHSNKELVKTNILKFKEHLKYENTFNASYVGTETGSFNDDKWTYNPLNRTEDAFLEVLRIFKDLADYAKECNSNMAIEGAYGHCMYEPKRVKRLLDSIDNGHVFIIVDIYNYLAYDNYMQHIKIFDECMDIFNNKIVIFHIKDFVVDEENKKLVQCAIGKGIMNFDYMLPKIKERNPNAYLIFEGSKPEDMEESLKFIKSKL